MYFVALLIYFSKINCHFTIPLCRILYRVRWSVIFHASLSTNLWHTALSETLPSNFTKFCVSEWSVNLPFLLSQKSLSYKMSSQVPTSLSLNSVSHKIIWHFLISPFLRFLCGVWYCHFNASFLPVMWLYHFHASLFQNSVSYEITQYLNNTIVSSDRPSHLHANSLSVYKHLKFAVKLAFLLCIHEPDNFHF